LINTIPDRPFALFIFAKDPVGDDIPVFYMELEIHGDLDRHTVVWELDQVLASVSRNQAGRYVFLFPFAHRPCFLRCSKSFKFKFNLLAFRRTSVIIAAYSAPANFILI